PRVSIDSTRKRVKRQSLPPTWISPTACVFLLTRKGFTSWTQVFQNALAIRAPFASMTSWTACDSTMVVCLPICRRDHPTAFVAMWTATSGPLRDGQGEATAECTYSHLTAR